MPFPGARTHARRQTEAGCSSRRRPETVHQDRLARTAFAVASAAPNATNADLAPLPGFGVNIGDHAARGSDIEIPTVFPTVETALGGTLEVPTETLRMWLWPSRCSGWPSFTSPEHSSTASKSAMSRTG